MHLKDPDSGAPIANNDPNATIVKRGDGTEVKEGARPRFDGILRCVLSA